MRSVAAIAIVIAACGGGPAGAPVKVAPTVPPPAAPTCDDVGVILRGRMEDVTAGPAKEKAIAQACLGDHWSQAVITCVASTTSPTDCVKQLTAPQQASYATKIANWKDADSDGVTDMPGPATCDEALHDVELFDPPIDDTANNREWQANARRDYLVDQCNTNAWREDMLSCLRDATTPPATATCVATLDPHVHQRLLELRDLTTAITSLQTKNAKLDCKTVAAHHYADAKWAGKLSDKKPASRKMIIEESRKKMADTCTAEAWDELTRACVIADGDDTACFGVKRWDYPPDGI